MEDKEVGEHWRWCQEEAVDGKDKLVDAMRGLIRKLVEDRQELCYRRDGGRWDWVDVTERERMHRRNKALRDFGIDPVTFK